MRLVFLPVVLARDTALFWLDAALAAVDVAVCGAVGHNAHWQKSTIGFTRRCDRCGAATGTYLEGGGSL